MKKSNLFLIILIVCGLAACRKEKANTIAAPAETRLRSIRQNNTEVGAFTYTTTGELARYTSFSTKVDYSYFDGGCGYKWFSNEQLTGEMKNTVMSNGRLSSYLYQYYSNGLPSWNCTMSFVHDADGYLTSWTDGTDIYDYEYAGGDFVKSTRKSNGVVTQTALYEYYTGKKSPLNLPLFEYIMEWPVLLKSQIGKPNQHLMKKSTQVYNGNTYTWDFSYAFDASGNITQYTQVYQKNNEAPVTTVYDLLY